MPAGVDDFCAALVGACVTAIEAGAVLAPVSGLPEAGELADLQAGRSCMLPEDAEHLEGGYGDPGNCVSYDPYAESTYDSPDASPVESAPSPATGDKPSSAPRPSPAPPSSVRERTEAVVEPKNQPPPAAPSDPPEKPVDQFNRVVGATNEAFSGGVFGYWLAGMFELAVDLDSLGRSNSLENQWRRETAEDAVKQFQDFGEDLNWDAAQKSETGALVGSTLGGLGPDLVSPSSKGKAGARGVQTAKLLADGAAAKAMETLIEKLVRNASKYKAQLKTLIERLGNLAEKGEAFRVLKEERKVLKAVPRKESSGAWLEKLHGKNSYEGKLKAPHNGIKTVQIDNLLVAEDGRLVLVESKAMNVGDLAKSAHLKFVTDPKKVDQIVRYIRFAKENPDAVSHIKILSNKEEVLQLYKADVAQLVLKAAPDISPAEFEALVEFGVLWK